ncbi:MAG: hypothetical protein HYV97_18805 [Bdellovibrio sp.]|nr:hypothetical protein [Bdellovibrio sp.]
MNNNLEVGNEIKIKTRDGKIYQGIFMAIHRGHLSAIASLGIIFTFPIKSIIDIIKI